MQKPSGRGPFVSALPPAGSEPYGRRDGGSGIDDESSLTLVLVAAGSGTRLGGENKVWRLVDARPLWWWAASRFAGLVREGVIVVEEDRVAEAERWVAGLSYPARVVTGGQERWQSSLAGIRASATPFVAVHDAARPLVSASLIRRTYEAAQTTGAAIPGLPPSDTVKVVEAGRVVRTLPREGLRLAQTPQIFRRDWMLEAAAGGASAVTDDVSWLEAAGYPVALVEGEIRNRKITTADDW